MLRRSLSLLELDLRVAGIMRSPTAQDYTAFYTQHEYVYKVMADLPCGDVAYTYFHRELTIARRSCLAIAMIRRKPETEALMLRPKDSKYIRDMADSLSIPHSKYLDWIVLDCAKSDLTLEQVATYFEGSYSAIEVGLQNLLVR